MNSFYEEHSNNSRAPNLSLYPGKKRAQSSSSSSTNPLEIPTNLGSKIDLLSSNMQYKRPVSIMDSSSLYNNKTRIAPVKVLYDTSKPVIKLNYSSMELVPEGMDLSAIMKEPSSIDNQAQTTNKGKNFLENRNAWEGENLSHNNTKYMKQSSESSFTSSSKGSFYTAGFKGQTGQSFTKQLIEEDRKDEFQNNCVSKKKSSTGLSTTIKNLLKRNSVSNQEGTVQNAMGLQNNIFSFQDEDFLPQETLVLISEEENNINFFKEIAEAEKTKISKQIDDLNKELVKMTEEFKNKVLDQVDLHYKEFLKKYEKFKEEVIEYKNVKIEVKQQSFVPQNIESADNLFQNTTLASNKELLAELEALRQQNHMTKIFQYINSIQKDQVNKILEVSNQILSQLGTLENLVNADNLQSDLGEIKASFGEMTKQKLDNLENYVMLVDNANAAQADFPHSLQTQIQNLQNTSKPPLNQRNFAQVGKPGCKSPIIENYVKFPVNTITASQRCDIENISLNKNMFNTRSKAEYPMRGGPLEETGAENMFPQNQGSYRKTLFATEVPASMVSPLMKNARKSVNSSSSNGIFTPQKPNVVEFSSMPLIKSYIQNPPDNRYMAFKGLQAVQGLSLSLSNYVRTDHNDAILCILHIKDSMVATGSKDKSIRLWNYKSRAKVGTLQGHQGSICCLSKNSSGTLIASGSDHDDCSIIVWDVQSQTQRNHLQRKGHRAAVIAVIFLHDNFLISGGYDKEILIWSLSSSDVQQRISAHSNSLTSLTVSFDSSRLISSSLDGVINIFEIRPLFGERLEKLVLEKSLRNGTTVNSLTYTNDKNYFISSDAEGKAKLWNVQSGQIIRNVPVIENCTNGGLDEALLIEEENAEPLANTGNKPFALISCAMNREGLVFANSNISSGIGKRQLLDLKEQAKFEYGAGVFPKIQFCRDLQKNLTQLVIVNQSEDERQFTIWNLKLC